MTEQTIILDPYEWAHAKQVGTARDESSKAKGSRGEQVSHLTAACRTTLTAQLLNWQYASLSACHGRQTSTPI